VDDLGKRDLRGVALRSPYGLPPGNAAARLIHHVPGRARAFAHDSVARIEERQAEQAALVEEGRRTGAITWREGRALRTELARIAALKRQFLDDGRLSWQERRELRSLQREARRRIEAESADSWRRVRFLPRVGR